MMMMMTKFTMNYFRKDLCLINGALRGVDCIALNPRNKELERRCKEAALV
jgi:hypothetical protein